MLCGACIEKQTLCGGGIYFALFYFIFESFQELSEFVNLQILYLHGNQINDISQIDQLTPLRSLRKLTLHGNPIENVKVSYEH